MDEINPNDYFDSDDNVDMCELEARLYASVHHEAVDNNIPVEIPQYVPSAVRTVSNTRVVNNPKTNIGRYWSNNMNQNKLMNTSNETRPFSFNINQPVYVPYTSETAEPEDNTSGNSNNKNNNNQTQKRVEEGIQPKSPQITNFANIPNNQKRQEKNKPKRKQADRRILNPMSKQIQNISQILKDNAVKQSRIDRYTVKKEKAAKSRAAQKNNKLIVIDLSDNDDDDVIVIPTKPPPTVCLDSSDESVISKSEFAAPNRVKGSAQHGKPNRRIVSANNSRCPSPSSSIVSDDFIIQNDRSRILEGSDLNIAQDEDLQCVQQTVESVVNPKKSTSIVGNTLSESINSTVETPSTATKDTSSSLSISSIENLNKTENSAEIFATPKHKLKKKENKNYQVKENSFAAVDVYESESSDMPESIYDRVKDKNPNNSVHLIVSSDDDENDESVNDIKVKKTKKLTKRKTSGSGKSSEYNSDSSDYILSQPSPGEIKLSASTPYSYIMRGDAVASNACENNDAGSSKRIKSAKKRCKFDSEHHSDDEFITLLSSIIHDASDGDDDSDDHNSDDNNMLPVFFNNKKPIDKGKNVPKSVEVTNISENTSTTNLNNEKPESSDTAENINATDGDIWNNEMIEFYNNSWGGEDFNTKSILNKMNASSVNWHINNADRFPRKSKGIRCLNCREIGHVRSRCPVIKKTICYMCGETGHRESRCPNKLCLKCGAPNRVYSKECRNCFHMKRSICRLCKLRGHTIEICPDKWRRYHSTITPQAKLINKSNNNNRVKYCCICAGKGHSDDKCVNALKTIDYSLSSYNIISYSDLYNYPTIKPDKQKFNLISEIPKDMDIKFNFDKNLNKDNFYKRFLKYISMKNMDENELLPTGKTDDSSRKRKSLCKQNVVISLNDSLQVKRSCQESDKDKNDIIKITVKADQRIVTNKSTVNSAVIDEDSNYSFNEFYSSQDDDANKEVETIQSVQNPKVTDVIGSDEKISDYIPLTAPTTASPSDVINTKQIDNNTNSDKPDILIDDCNVDDDRNVQEDAKIFLSKEKIKELLTNDGTVFIQNSRKKYNINIILKWHSYSNFLIIIGTKSAQNQFYNDLKLFFNTKLSETRKQNVLSTLPKNKQMLIKFLRMNLNKLNNDNLGDIEYLYEQTCLNLNRSSDKSRNLLNMILIGQKGLRNGHQIIKELYNNIKSLENNTELNVSIELRKKICANYQHIFCPIDDIDYNLLIKEYHQMEMQSKNVNKRAMSNQEPSTSANEDKILLNVNYDTKEEKSASDTVIPESTTIATITPTSAVTTNNNDYIPVDTQEQNKPSKYWSNKSLVIIIKCLALVKGKHPYQVIMFNKLNLIKTKAYKNNLSYKDYEIIVKIYDVINKKIFK